MNCFLKSIHQSLISSKNFLVLSRSTDPMRLKLNLSTSLLKPVLFPFLSIFFFLGSNSDTTFPSISGWMSHLGGQIKHQALCILHTTIPAHTANLCSCMLEWPPASCPSHGHLNVNDLPHVQMGRMRPAQSLVNSTYLLFQQFIFSSSSWTKHQIRIFQTSCPC